VLESRKNLPRKHERYKGGTAFICVCVGGRPKKQEERGITSGGATEGQKGAIAPLTFFFIIIKILIY
jgi:hypothetical protein